jgi:hypothetical protein
MASLSQGFPGCQSQHMLPIGSALELMCFPDYQSLNNVGIDSGDSLVRQALPGAWGQDLDHLVRFQAPSEIPIARAQKKKQV